MSKKHFSFKENMEENEGGKWSFFFFFVFRHTSFKEGSEKNIEFAFTEKYFPRLD
jgi:hypothetical protein